MSNILKEEHVTDMLSTTNDPDYSHLNDEFSAVFKEYRRACQMYRFPPDPIHATAIVAEEVGELIQSVNNLYHHNKGSLEEVRTEAIQSAAMCLRFLVNLEKYHWDGMYGQ